ncbi:MAG: 50S ribosomal protein L13 [Chloroflexi bacterium]|nr:50S ribosomal protein L13 [Chloroflexota bacterium]
MSIKRTPTYSAKTGEIEASWQVLDAAGVPLGRLASEIAGILQGKHRPTYTPHIITGDFVIVVNAAKVGLTGQKAADKVYYHHSGYPSGLTRTSYSKMIAKHPDHAIKRAVKGMLPKNVLAQHLLKRLKVYPGPDHPHQAQVVGAPKQQEETPELTRPS